MDLVQLNCLVTVAQLGTITAAAAQLHISQPAITKRLQALESELGITLFTRQGRHLILNHCGKQLLPRAEEVLAACQAFRHAAAEAQCPRTVRLSVRAASSLLPQLLLQLRKAHPEMDLQVVQDQDRYADLTIDATLDETWPHGTRLLLKEEVVLAVPKVHPLAAQEAVYPEDLCQYPFISLCQGRAMRDIEDTLCARGDITPHRAVECDTPATLRGLVTQGLGIAFAASRSWFVEPDTQVQLIPLAPRHWRYVTLRPAAPLLNDPAILSLCQDIQGFFHSIGQG